MTSLKRLLLAGVCAASLAGCASAAYGSVETGSGTTLIAGAKQGFWNSSARVWLCSDAGKEQCKEVEVTEANQ